MSFVGPLGEVIAALNAVGVPYMVAGSVASSVWGELRASQDVDLVVEAGRADLVGFCRVLESERWYADKDMAIEAARTISMFNVLDTDSGWKFDIIVRKGRPFSREEFSRRRTTVVDGLTVFIASPEDTILAKLEWARRSESERQVRDAAGIVRVQGEALDVAYIERWAGELGVLDLWGQVRGR